MNADPLIRLGCFGTVLVLLAIAEHWQPRRPASAGRRRLHNLALVVVNTLVLRLVPAFSAVGAALAAEEHGWGLLHAVVLPDWVAFILAMLALDLAIYAQHVVFHAVPVLWRLHRVHHADPDFDVTTGLRFHPLEIGLSMAFKIGLVAALGIPTLAVVVFEIALNATAMFSHANLRLPGRLDRLLRLVVVTPDMHRVHHSVIPSETNRNFGFNLPWWDWLFRTYQAQPAAGHEGMTIGLTEFREPWVSRLWGMLALPFVSRERRAGGVSPLRDCQLRDACLSPAIKASGGR